MRRILVILFAIMALSYVRSDAVAQPVVPSNCTVLTPCFVTGTITGTVTTVPTPMTYQGTMTLAAATSTALIAANVTMTFGTLPAPGAFVKLVLIAPQGCTFTVNWDGGSATATSGEQMGVGTNVGTDTVYLTGLANAPTLFSTAGCATPNLVQFHN